MHTSTYMCTLAVVVMLAATLAAAHAPHANVVPLRADDGARVALETFPHGEQWELPHDWEDSGRVDDDDAPIELLFVLRHANMDAVERHFWAVSTPGSPQYGAHWTHEELAEVMRPAVASEAAVRAFVGVHATAIEVTGVAGEYVTATVPVRAAEALLHVEFRAYTHTASRVRLHRAPAHTPYTVPAALAAHVDMVAGVHRLVRHPRAQSELGGVGKITFATTPAVIHERYNVTLPESVASNSQAVISFLGQYFSYSDLHAMQAALHVPKQDPVDVYGPNDESKPGVEAELDIQYLIGVAQGVRTFVWSTPGDHQGQEPFMKWLGAMQQAGHTQNVLSISYQDYENTVSATYMQSVNNAFVKLGAMGVSVHTGSGDWGTLCATTCDKFVADFPSASPYAVSTGATSFMQNAIGEEMATPWSSGGFSETFDRPSYQDDVVRAYLDKTTVPRSYYRAGGRAFPDVSTLGVNFQVWVEGKAQNVGGTSAATPTFAAMVSLWNDVRLAAGKPRMGFVLPFVYDAYAKAGTAAFHDVVHGNNQYGCCAVGFDCVEGWDPVTGLGTPNWGTLAEMAMDEALWGEL